MLQIHNPSFAPMFSQKSRVLMAVCTYKRPKMLDACLSSLLAQGLIGNYEPAIAVVDNDPEMSGHQPFIKCQRYADMDMHYLHEKIRGIARARNKALDFAIEHDFDFIAFLDDDEIAHADWLPSLMHPAWANQPVIYGRRIFDYSAVPSWARPPKGDDAGLPNGAPCKAFTHNVRIAKSVFSRIRFDESLGLAGGEDGDYFARARKLGYGARFARGAITYEVAHPERMTFWGQMDRAYWIGASSLREAITEKGPRYRWLKLGSILAAPVIATGHILAGALLYGANQTRGLQMMLRGCKHASKSYGRLMAIVGHIPQSYIETVGA